MQGRAAAAAAVAAAGIACAALSRAQQHHTATWEPLGAELHGLLTHLCDDDGPGHVEWRNGGTAHDEEIGMRTAYGLTVAATLEVGEMEVCPSQPADSLRLAARRTAARVLRLAVECEQHAAAQLGRRGHRRAPGLRGGLQGVGLEPADSSLRPEGTCDPERGIFPDLAATVAFLLECSVKQLAMVRALLRTHQSSAVARPALRGRAGPYAPCWGSYSRSRRSGSAA